MLCTGFHLHFLKIADRLLNIPWKILKTWLTTFGKIYGQMDNQTIKKKIEFHLPKASCVRWICFLRTHPIRTDPFRTIIGCISFSYWLNIFPDNTRNTIKMFMSWKYFKQIFHIEEYIIVQLRMKKYILQSKILKVA